MSCNNIDCDCNNQDLEQISKTTWTSITVDMRRYNFLTSLYDTVRTHNIATSATIVRTKNHCYDVYFYHNNIDEDEVITIAMHQSLFKIYMI